MNEQAGSRDPQDEGAPKKSRLDLEVEEILRKSDNVRPFPAARARPVKGPASPGNGPAPIPASVSAGMRKALDTPLLVALALAILALMVSTASPLLATLCALGAVVFVLLPVVQRFRRPASAPETKMWRGREIDSRPTTDSVMESVRRWWRSRQP